MKPVLSVLVALIAIQLNAQVPQTSYDAKSNDPDWIQLMYSQNPNLVELQLAYDDFYKSNSFEKNRHTQYYKRLMREGLPHVNSQGFPQVQEYDERDYLERYQAQQVQREDGVWEEMGPWHFDPEVAYYFQVQSPGACHVYTVEQSPSDPDIIFCGTATAGLWKSVDKGMHWDLMTRDMLVTSVYSIAIHPENADIVYFGEGTGMIYKSIDGGSTWNATSTDGLNDDSFWTRDLKIKPNDPEVVFAATNDALYRSDTGGDSWTSIFNGEYMELEFKPDDPETIYTVKLVQNNTLFQKSTDGGLSFGTTGTGWPTPGVGEEQKRCEMSVSPASADRIYVLASGSADGGNGLFGTYLSEDAGETWEFHCCGTGPGGLPAVDTNPNILGWSEGGEGDGGQYYYDLAHGASPDSPDKVFGAGINVWRSEDAGSNWALNGHWVTWVGDYLDRYTHADVHDIKFFQNDDEVDMWVASDGGLFYSSDQGDHFEPRMYGLHGTDFWGWQGGPKHGDVMVGGTYHNGTLIRNDDLYFWGLDIEESGGWLAELAGDNFRGFVNPGDPTIGYHDGGSFRYTEDRFSRISGLTFDNSKLPNTAYWWGEYGNMEWDPRCYNNMYSPVGSTLWATKDGGASWTELHDFGGEKIVHVKVAARDGSRLYVTHKNSGSDWRIWTSDDAGETWTNITPANGDVGGNNGRPKYIDVHGTDPNTVWMVILGNQTGNKVFRTTDAGMNWENLTAPEIAYEYGVYVVHQRGTNNGVYLGTDKTVYYTNDDMNGWEMWANGLPAKNVATFMQANYCQGKIRTAGPRGVHQCDFYEESGVQAAFMADQLVVNLGIRCDIDTVKFSDNSVVRCEDASYEWAFEGGNPLTSTEEYPEVVFGEVGSYDVTLTVTDMDANTDTWTWEDMIQVVNEPVGFPIVEDFNEGFPPEHWKIENPDGGGSWEQGQVLGEEGNLVAQFPNYWVDTQGQTDLIVMPAVDLTDEQDPILFFDVSYQVYADYIDGLEVWYRTGSNLEWQTIYSRSGVDLAVENNYVWFWYDEGGELLWRTDTVDLSPLEGESCVQLAFSNLGGYGNHIWVDNVNITTDDGTDVHETLASSDFLIYPNPANETVSLRFPTRFDLVQVSLIDMRGRQVRNEVLQSSERMNIAGIADGLYQVKIQTKEGVVFKKLMKK